jgi:hypothetical protein
VTEFEIRQLMLETDGVITQQFQFWMAATFAVVVASYTAGSRLALWARVCVTALYLGATLTFFLRYYSAASSLIDYNTVLGEIGPMLPEQVGLARSIGVSRMFVMLGGTVLAILLVFFPTVSEKQETNDRGTQ